MKIPLQRNFTSANATQKELMEVINSVMKGKTYFSEEAVDVLLKTEDSAAPVITHREKEGA